MEARYIQVHLRRCGVVVHHATGIPPSADGWRGVVVFLEASLHQYELAQRCVLKLPGVLGVSFSGHTPTIMYVYGVEPGRRMANGAAPDPDAQRRRNVIRAKRAPGPVTLPGAERRLTNARRQS